MSTSKEHAEKRSAALGSVVAAACMTLLKLIAGLLTGSLGMLSETAHSALDLAAAGLTLFAVQASDKPADEDHNYGHGKIENLSAFIETFLMAASCVWIVTEAVRRLLSGRVEIKASPWPVVVLLASIVVDYTRSRNLMRVARSANSQALEADALHFGTDIWSSVAVLIGVGAAYLGARLHIGWLQYADAVSALVVSAIILYVSWQLARKTVDALLDAVPQETHLQLVRAIGKIDDVKAVQRVRVRRAGNEYFADVTIGLPRALTFQRSEQITYLAREAVRRILPEADVVVHSVPMADSGESVFDRVRAVASRNNFAVHDVSVRQIDGALYIEQHMEVPETLSLREAHDMVTLLETQMRREVPEIEEILTHIENEPATIEKMSVVDQDRELEVRLRKTAQEFPEILDVHHVLVTRAGEHVQVNCHCTLPDDLPMSRVHEVITELESRFKSENTVVSRMLIHPEPATDNRR